MASMKKRQSPTTSTAVPDAGDTAANWMQDVQTGFQNVVEGARLETIAARERGEKLVALVQAKKVQIARNFYDIGKALSELRRDKLYVALGSASLSQLLRDRDLVGLTQAKKFMAIADAFDRTKALELGTEKAYALVRMANATPEDDTPLQLATGNLRVAGKTKKAAVLTATDIEKAARALQAKTGTARKQSPEEKAAQTAARKLQASLRRAGAKRALVEPKRLAGEWKLVVTVAVAHAELLAATPG